ncbi:hypothetical protein F4779DRAFT_627599 [Xylariaceae sp. FL0662B]|nr:hypothetical protein F4779DRAFT_627599 [Xylariaceae sp. FL0662B]
MQRVSALSLLPWDRNRSSTSTNASVNTHNRKNSGDLVRGWADKISPIGRLGVSHVSKEAFWPGTLDKECEKAARILKSFCSDGFSTPNDRPGSPSTLSSGCSSHKFLKKIPPRIIQNAVGLAVFTSMRSGLWTSGSGGSGILIARKTDGTWSPPSGLVLQTASLGFVIGVDIYDCVLVINNFTVLESFAGSKLTLGTDVTLTNGPLVALGLLENDVTWADLSDTAITYVKARGQCAEVKLDGTVINERADENERFYGMKISVAKILAGDINQSLPQTRLLTEMLKAAEGRTDYDTALVEQLSSQPAPGDVTLESPNTPVSPPSFGIPGIDDPDPFGVLALEMAGMGIREAGTGLRPESRQFEFNPSPTSPFFPKFSRQSVDTFLSRSNRGSYMSSRTMATERSQMTDAGTQTYPVTPETTPSSSQSQSEDGNHPHAVDDVPEVKEPIEVDYTKIDISALRSLSSFPDLDDEPTTTTITKSEPQPDIEDTTDARNTQDALTETGIDGAGEEDEAEANLNETVYADEAADDADDADDEDFDGDEEAIIFEVATAQTPARMAVAASQVNIPRRVPPPLPARSPARGSRTRSQMLDANNMVSSPLRQQFELDSEAQEQTTPKARDSAVKPLDTSDQASTKEADIPDGVKGTTEIMERTVTPVKDSQGVDGYFPKFGERSPLRENAATPASASLEEQPSLETRSNVPVSVV